MYSKFTFSHKYDVEEENKKKIQQAETAKNNSKSFNLIKNQQKQEEDDFDDLFVIGNRNIIQEKQKQMSKQRQNKQKKIKKEKKDKKQKKQKSQKKQKKHKDKQKKKKKHKTAKKHQSEQQSGSQTPLLIKISSESSENRQMVAQNAMQKLERKMQILSKYQKQLSSYRTPECTFIAQSIEQQNILNKQFGLKQKINDKTLPIDIIKFGLPELYQYGLQDREIPYYKRYPLLKTIIGMKKKKKKILKYLRELNMTTNQLGVNWNKYDNQSYDRYFHYKGYENLGGQNPQKYIIIEQTQQIIDQNREEQPDSRYQLMLPNPTSQHKANIPPSVPFNPPPNIIKKLATNQQKLRLINKQYNSSLNENPQDIDQWLKFLDLQDSISELTLSQSDYTQSQQQKNALLERKIAIVAKGLQKNQLNWQLGLKYVALLAEAKKDRREIQEFTRKLLEAHPESEEIWRFYLEFKLANIVRFKHSILQKQFEQINTYLFENRIKQVKSGKEVWKIRKCGLVILAEVLKFHRLQGYYELCTAICCALLEFNIFCGEKIAQLPRQERLALFKQYWEDYNVYKLGEMYSQSYKEDQQLVQNSWQGYLSKRSRQNKINENTIQIVENGEYIENKFKRLQQKSNRKQQRWLPCHSLHNIAEISSHPQTFILFQDIELYLQAFRNQQNWHQLLNITMQNLRMPPIFAEASASMQQEYITAWLANTIMFQQSQESLYVQHSFEGWNRFWHPRLSLEFLQIRGNVSDGGQVCRFVYAINLVKAIRVKFRALGDQKCLKSLNQYLMFLYGTIYHLHSQHPKPSSVLPLLSQFPKEHCLSQIQNLLGSNPSNIFLWALYIEFEIESGKQIQQCIQCYLSCLTTFGNDHRDSQSQNPKTGNQSSQQSQRQIIQLEILYWISQFLYRWGYKIENKMKGWNCRGVVASLLKKILLQQQKLNSPEPLSLSKLQKSAPNLSQMQKLLMGTKLKDLLKQYTPSYSQDPNTLALLYYTLVQIGQSPQSIVPHLLHLKTEFSVNMLIDLNLLELEHIKEYNLITDIKCQFKIIHFFVTAVGKDCKGRLQGLYQLYFQNYCCKIRKFIKNQNNKTEINKKIDFYEENCQNRLYIWLLMMRMLEPELRKISQSGKNKQHKNGIQYFLTIAQKFLISTRQPVCVEIVCKLMMNPNFAYQCLSTFPYCRKMYEIAALDVENAEKIYRLIHEKQIRLNI